MVCSECSEVKCNKVIKCMSSTNRFVPKKIKISVTTSDMFLFAQHRHLFLALCNLFYFLFRVLVVMLVLAVIRKCSR